MRKVSYANRKSIEQMQGGVGDPLFICLSWCFSISGLENLATLVLAAEQTVGRPLPILPLLGKNIFVPPSSGQTLPVGICVALWTDPLLF